jgi:hypothetical protein
VGFASVPPTFFVVRVAMEGASLCAVDTAADSVDAEAQALANAKAISAERRGDWACMA